MGFGHRVYRAEDPRARVLRRTCQRTRLAPLRGGRGAGEGGPGRAARRQPDRVLATNVEFWSAVILDLAEVPPDLFTPMFTCARVAGWSAHILEQKREDKLIRPTAKYVGHGPRSVAELASASVEAGGIAPEVDPYGEGLILAGPSDAEGTAYAAPPHRNATRAAGATGYIIPPMSGMPPPPRRRLPSRAPRRRSPRW